MSYRLLRVFPKKHVYVYTGTFDTCNEAMIFADQHHIGVFVVQRYDYRGYCTLYQTGRDDYIEYILNTKTNTWYSVNLSEIGSCNIRYMTELTDCHDGSQYENSSDSDEETLTGDEMTKQDSK